MNELTMTALSWLDQGIGTLPIQFHDKRPDARALKRAGFINDGTGFNGPAPAATTLKNPHFGELSVKYTLSKSTWRDLQSRLPTPKEIEAFFVSGLTNLAVITGWRGLVVIDFDDLSTFLGWWSAFPIHTYMVATARGVHVYLFSEDPAPARKAKGIDIKAAGGYVLAPPSIHPSGAPYQVFNTAPILQVKSIDPFLPDDLFPSIQELPSVHNLPSPTPLPVNDQSTGDPWLDAEAGGVVGKDLISTIKERFPILGFFPDAQSTQPGGRWFIAKCPLHDDHNPSMWIDAARGLCGCYAGCQHGRPLDAINFYSALRGVDNQAAMLELQRML